MPNLTPEQQTNENNNIASSVKKQLSDIQKTISDLEKRYATMRKMIESNQEKELLNFLNYEVQPLGDHGSHAFGQYLDPFAKGSGCRLNDSYQNMINGAVGGIKQIAESDDSWKVIESSFLLIKNKIDSQVAEGLTIADRRSISTLKSKREEYIAAQNDILNKNQELKTLIESPDNKLSITKLKPFTEDNLDSLQAINPNTKKSNYVTNYAYTMQKCLDEHSAIMRYSNEKVSEYVKELQSAQQGSEESENKIAELKKQEEMLKSIITIIEDANLTYVGKINSILKIGNNDAVKEPITKLSEELKKAGFDTIVTNLNEYDTLTSFDKDTTKSLNDLFSNALENRYNDMCEAVDSGWKSFDSIFGNVANKENELYKEIENKDNATKESVKEVFGKINSDNNLTLGDKISKFNSALDEYKKTEQYQSNLFGELVIDKLKLITDNELAELNDLTDLENLIEKLNDDALREKLNIFKAQQKQKEESIKNIINDANLTYVGKIHSLAGFKRSDAIANEIDKLLKDLEKADFDTIVKNLNEYDNLLKQSNNSFIENDTKSLNGLFSNALGNRYDEMCKAVDSGWKSFDSIFGNVANKENELYKEIESKDNATKESVKEVFGKINSDNNILGDKISVFNNILDQYTKDQYKYNLFRELAIDKLKSIINDDLKTLDDINEEDQKNLESLTLRLNDPELTDVLNAKLKALAEQRKEQAEQADLNGASDILTQLRQDLGSIATAQQQFFSVNGEPDFQTTKKYAGLDENVNIDRGENCILYTDNALNKLLDTLQSECRDTVERKDILNPVRHHFFVTSYNKLLSEVLIAMLQNDITDAKYTTKLNEDDFNKKIEDLTNQYEDKFAKLTAEFEGKIKQQNTDLNNKIDTKFGTLDMTVSSQFNLLNEKREKAQKEIKSIIDKAQKDFTSEIEKLKTENIKSVKRIEGVENKVGDLEKENKYLKEQNAALKEQNGALEEKFKKFEAGVNTQLDFLVKQMEKLAQENAALKQKVQLDLNKINEKINQLNDPKFSADAVSLGRVNFSRHDDRGVHIEWQRPSKLGTNLNKSGNKEIGNKEIGNKEIEGPYR